MLSSGGGRNKSRVDARMRLVIVDSPDVAAPLIDALDVADIGAWMWVEAERALYFSSRLLDLIGLDAEPRATLLTRFFQSVHADDQEAVRNLLLGSAPGGPFKLRYRFTPPGGPLRWIEDRGRVQRDASGVLLRQGGALRDVTHEVGAELERQEADARLEALVNAMPFAVWGRGGRNLHVTHQNAESIAVWGDMRGQTLSDAPPDVRSVWEQQLADAMTGAVVRARREFTRDGSVHAIDEIIAPVIVEDRVTGVVGVAFDVTEEARAARFQAVLTEISADFAGRSTETLDAGMVLALEKVARFIGAPAAMLCDLGDGTREDQLRITHWWVDPATGRQQPRLLDVDVSQIRSLLQRVELNSPVVIRSRDDLVEGSIERAWLEKNAQQSFAIVPTRQLDGRRTLLGLSGAADGIVEWPADTVPCMRLAATLLGGVLARARADADQKAVERRMQDAQRLESLGVLTGGIAHDFNNLLTAILGNAGLLRAELRGVEGVSDGIGQIEVAARRAAELCRQMLAYAGRGRFALQPLDLNALLRDMRSVLEVTVPRAANLTLTLAPSLPAVFADEAQIRQLIMNLVFNAVEALDGQAGTITLRTTCAPRTAQELARTVFSPRLPDGRYVSLMVSDTGSGMSPETTARIFDPFFSTKSTGRGLGLGAVVGAVRAHNGALRVQSQLGEGSTFELMLPAQHERPATPVEPISPSSHAALLSWRTRGTALVVDDERGVRDLVRTVLERAGMTVVVADDGERGIKAFERLGADVRVVLVDLTMPGLDGRATLAAIRRLRSDVPAILMSGYARADLLNSSSHVFLQKPFTPDMLRTVMKRVLDE